MSNCLHFSVTCNRVRGQSFAVVLVVCPPGMSYCCAFCIPGPPVVFLVSLNNHCVIACHPCAPRAKRSTLTFTAMIDRNADPHASTYDMPATRQRPTGRSRDVDGNGRIMSPFIPRHRSARVQCNPPLTESSYRPKLRYILERPWTYVYAVIPPGMSEQPSPRCSLDPRCCGE